MGKYSELVYRVSYEDCNIGEIRQLIKIRLANHRRYVQAEKINTTLCEHTIVYGHSFDFKKAAICCYEENDSKRKLRKSIEIAKHVTAVNFKTGY